jgi:HD superfamily phosphohydrolase
MSSEVAGAQKRDLVDPIYGHFSLYDHEAQIISEPFFSRLHWIKQLGLSCFQYPSANHTRFEHCLGTLHVANNILLRLSNQLTNDPETRKIQRRLADKNTEPLTRLSALLHDIGHGPFSHTIEEFLERNPEFGVRDGKDHPIMKKWDSKLSKVLQEEPDLERYVPVELAEHEDFARLALVREFPMLARTCSRKIAERLLDIFGKDANRDPVVKMVKRIIDGDIDADKIDYLLRDTHHVGFRHSSVDMQDIVNNLILTKLWKESELNWEIGVGASGVLAVESLLLTRNRHYDILATNPENRRFEMTFIKALEHAFKKANEEDVREFIYRAYSELSDDSFLEKLRERYKVDIRSRLKKAAELQSVLDARWARFLPNTRFDLYMAWRNGRTRRTFEEHLEKEISDDLGDHDFMVELTYHGALPAALLLSAVPGYTFLYDYSTLVRHFQEMQFRNGRINVYATKDANSSDIERKLESLVFPRDEKGKFYEELKDYLAGLGERVRRGYNTAPDLVVLRCRDLDRLAALMFMTYRICIDLKDREGGRNEIQGEWLFRKSRFSIPYILTTRTRLYGYVRGVTKLVSGFMSYEEHIDLCSIRAGAKGFYYCREMYEDFQILKSMGLISEIVTPQSFNLDGSFASVPAYNHFLNVKSLQKLFDSRERPELNAQLAILENKRGELTKLYESSVKN